MARRKLVRPGLMPLVLTGARLATLENGSPSGDAVSAITKVERKVIAVAVLTGTREGDQLTVTQSYPKAALYGR